MSEPVEVELDPAVVTELLLDARDKLHQSLLDIAKMKDEGSPDWRPALLDVFTKYCQEIGFDLEAFHPLARLYQELAEPIWKARAKSPKTASPLRSSGAECRRRNDCHPG